MYARTVRALHDENGEKNAPDRCPSFPWMEEMFGPELQVGFKRGTHGKLESRGTNALLNSYQYVGVYFAANWAPTYCNFTPQLLEFYDNIQNWKPQMMEIVYVSADCSYEKYEELMCTKYPFPAIKYEDTERKAALRKKFDNRGICSLVVMDSCGHIVSATARLDIEKAKHDFSLALAAWNASAKSGSTAPGGRMVAGLYTLFGPRELEVVLMLKDNGQFWHNVKLFSEDLDASGSLIGYDAARAGMYRVVKNSVYLTYTQDKYATVKRKSMLDNEWVEICKVAPEKRTMNKEYVVDMTCMHIDTMSRGAHQLSSHVFAGSKPVVVLKNVPGILGEDSPAPSHNLHCNWTRQDWGNTFMVGEADDKRHFAFSKLHAVAALTGVTDTRE